MHHKVEKTTDQRAAKAHTLKKPQPQVPQKPKNPHRCHEPKARPPHGKQPWPKALPPPHAPVQLPQTQSTGLSIAQNPTAATELRYPPSPKKHPWQKPNIRYFEIPPWISRKRKKTQKPHQQQAYKPNPKQSHQIKAVTSCSTHKIDQQETDG